MGRNELSGSEVFWNHGGEHRHVGFSSVSISGNAELRDAPVVVLHTEYVEKRILIVVDYLIFLRSPYLCFLEGTWQEILADISVSWWQ